MKDSLTIFEKPYISKSELSFLTGKSGSALDKLVSRKIKSGELLSLKKGYYVSAQYLADHSPVCHEFIANSLYYPSYLSLEYVLSMVGIIPETIYIFTSVTPLQTRTIQNQLGVFSYRHMKPELITGFTSQVFSGNYQIKRATLAKALFDWLYLQPSPRTKKDKRQILADARLNYSTITPEDLDEFADYVAIDHSPKMTQLLQILTEEVHRAH